VLATEIGEELGQGVAGLGLAEGCQDHQARAVRGARELADHQQRFLIGPVQVIEHEQGGAGGGNLREGRDDGVDEAVARQLAPLDLRAFREANRDLRDEPGEHRGMPRKAPAALQLLGRRVDRPVAKGLDEGLIAARSVFVGPSVEDPGGGRIVDALGELRGQPRLSHPRIAADECEMWPARRCLFPQVLEPPQLSGPPHEGTAVGWHKPGGEGELGGGSTWLGCRRGVGHVISANPAPRTAEEASVQRLDLGSRGRSELLAQDPPKPLVGSQRLRRVAGCDQRPHQQQIGGLAKRGRAHQLPRRALGAGEL
jgi:hypothetical protein